jgi:hypothetical protein
VQGFQRRVTRVPFSLVLDGTFQRDVIIEASDLEHAACGELLPVDLHLAAGELLDAAQLQALEALAAAALADGKSEVVVNVSSQATAAALGVEVSPTMRRARLGAGASASSGAGGRIDVSGGRWRDRR